MIFTYIHRMKILHASAFYLLLTTTLNGQYVRNTGSEDGKAYVYHNDSIKCLDFHAGSLLVLRNSAWVPYGSIEVPEEPMRSHQHPMPVVHQTPDTVLITFPGSGTVYSMSQNGHVRRHDRTYYTGYNYGACQIFEHDTLFSLGGVGFWRVTDLAIYYDPELREWERKLMNPPITEGYSAGFCSKLQPMLFRMIASSRKDFNGTEYTAIAFDVNLRDQTYRNVGVPVGFANGRNLSDFDGVGSAENWSMVTDQNQNYLVNLAENRLIQCGTSPQYAGPFTGSNGVLFHPKGVLLIETASTVTNAVVKVSHETVQSLIADRRAVDLGAAYETTTKHLFKTNILLITVLALLTLFLLFFIVQYQRNRPSAEIQFAGRLSSLARISLRHLLLQSPDSLVTPDELNQILGIEDKTWDNQRKIRSTVLQELEEKGMQYLGVPSFIERVASEEDRRIRRYRIKREFRDDLLPVLKHV